MDAERPAPARRRIRPVAWEPVWQGSGEGQATVVAAALEAAGMRARTQGGTIAGGRVPALTQDFWAVIVRSREAERARHYLRLHDEGSNVVSAEPGPRTSDQLATLKFAAVALLGLALFALATALYYSV